MDPPLRIKRCLLSPSPVQAATLMGESLLHFILNAVCNSTYRIHTEAPGSSLSTPSTSGQEVYDVPHLPGIGDGVDSAFETASVAPTNFNLWAREWDCAEDFDLVLTVIQPPGWLGRCTNSTAHDNRLSTVHSSYLVFSRSAMGEGDLRT